LAEIQTSVHDLNLLTLDHAQQKSACSGDILSVLSTQDSSCRSADKMPSYRGVDTDNYWRRSLSLREHSTKDEIARYLLKKGYESRSSLRRDALFELAAISVS
jgi:hypothetical protein